MSRIPLTVVGCGGHSLSIISLVNDLENYAVSGYTDLVDKGEVLGAYYLGREEELDPAHHPNVLMGISYLKNAADRSLRFELTKKLEDLGFHFPNVISKTAIVSKNVTLTKGTIVFNGAIINTNTVIGDHGIINTGAVIEHGCKIGNQFFLGPNATLCGDITIGNNVFVGAGSVIKDGITICDDVVIGMGATITRSINEPGIYIGNPGKIIKNNNL